MRALLRYLIALAVICAVIAPLPAGPIQRGHLAVLAKKRAGGGSPAWSDVVATQSNGENTSRTMQPVVAGQSGNCTKIRVYIGDFFGSVAIKVALYDNSNNLLSQGNSTITAGNGYTEVNITSQAVTGSTTYKLAFSIPAGSVFVYSQTIAGNEAEEDSAIAHAAFPEDPWSPDITTANKRYSVGMYIEP